MQLRKNDLGEGQGWARGHTFPHRKGVIAEEGGYCSQEQLSGIIAVCERRLVTAQGISQIFLAPSSSRSSRMVGFSPQRGHFFWRAMGEE